MNKLIVLTVCFIASIILVMIAKDLNSTPMWAGGAICLTVSSVLLTLEIYSINEKRKDL